MDKIASRQWPDIAIEVPHGNLRRRTRRRKIRNSPIWQPVVAQPLHLQRDGARLARLPQKRRRKRITVLPVKVPLTSLVLRRARKPKSQLPIGPSNNRVQIRDPSLLSVAAGRVAQFGQRTLHAWLLRHPVDKTARRASTIKNCRRTFEHLNSLRVRKIPVVLRAVTNSVDIHVVYRIEPADEEVISSSFSQLQTHRRHHLHRLLHALCSACVQQLSSKHQNLLWCLQNRHGHPRRRRREIGL